jgi:hypothetical protein
MSTTTEGNLYELALSLLKELDETEDVGRVRALQRQINGIAVELGELGGYSLTTADGNLLVMCLDEDQARALQSKLLITGTGVVTTVATAFGPIDEFIHPETNLDKIAEALTE